MSDSGKGSDQENSEKTPGQEVEVEADPLSIDSISSRGPVQIVNVYSGKAAEGSASGVMDWLKGKFEELKKSLMAGGQDRGAGHTSSWQPLITNSMLFLVMLAVMGQAAFQIYMQIKEKHKDENAEEQKNDNADRQMLTAMLAMMAARNQAPVVTTAPAQSDASPKIVVMPISVPSTAPSPPPNPNPPAKIQFEPLQIDVKGLLPANNTGGSGAGEDGTSKETPEAKAVKRSSANRLTITASLDPDNKCKKQSDEARPLIYFAFLNDGPSAIWIDYIESPLLTTAKVNDLSSDQKSPAPFQPQILYPGGTYILSSSCSEAHIRREAPGYIHVGIKYRLNQKDESVFIERAEFYVSPPATPIRVLGFSNVVNTQIVKTK